MSRDYTEITDEQLRTINKRAIEQPSYEELREQNRVLRLAIKELVEACDAAGKSGHHVAVGIRVKLGNAKAALTATSQEGQHEGR